MNLMCVNLPYVYPYKLEKFSRGSRSPCNTRGGTLYEPVYLANAVAYATREGYSAKVVDCIADKIDIHKLFKIIKKNTPDVMAIDTSTPSIKNDVMLSEILQRKFPNTKVVLVGRHVTYAPTETLQMIDDTVDVVTRNYYYQQLLDLIAGKEYKDIKGISYKEDNTVIHNPPATLPEGEYPFVSKIYHTQLHLEKYFYASLRNPYLLMMYGHGCAYNCSFCNELRKCNYVHRPIENLIQEMKYVQKKMPFIKEILFDDPTFVINENETCELCNAMIDAKITLPWSTATRANISLETLKIMKKAGNRLNHIGLETPNSTNLDDFIHKGMKFEDEVEYLKNCEKAGILNHGAFIIGLPFDTNESLQSGLEYIKKLPGLDSIQCFPLIPTPFENIFGQESKNTTWDYVREHKFLIETDYSKWLKPDGSYNVVVNYPHLSAREITWWVERYYKEFYFRPRYFKYKIQQSINSWDETLRNYYAFKNTIGV